MSSSQSPEQTRKRRRSQSSSNRHLGIGPSNGQQENNQDEFNLSEAGTPSALAASTPGQMSDIRSSPPPSSLPPSSPPAAFSDLTGDDDEEDEERVLDDERDARHLGHAYNDDGEDENEDEEGEDLYGDSMVNDYTINPDLDTYDKALDINDDESITAMDETSRRLAELKMQRRDRAEGKMNQTQRSRAPAFMQFDDEEDLDNTDIIGGRRRRRHHYDEQAEDEDEEGAEDMPLEQIADVKTDSIAEWIAQPNVRRTIAREFRNFLVTYVDERGVSVYGQRVKALGELNSESLEISFLHLVDAKALLAYYLVQCPGPMLDIFDDVAFEVTQLYYPNYDRIHPEIHVRIAELPTRYSLRDLRQEHLNQLVRVEGVVTRRTGVFPQLKFVKFDCLSCGNILGPFHQEASQEVKVTFCNGCEKRGPFRINTEQTVYRNYQKLTLQESPGSVPPGRLPRHREVILLWDLIDSARPGEEVEITGVYRNNFDASLNTKNGFPVFATVLEANHVAKRDDAFAAFRMTEEDEQAIRALARDPNIGRRIRKSIAPSIYGHDDIKTAIALSLFGGVPKDVGGKHRVRGDINVLMLGDPGTAKSQFLKYVEKTASRAVFTTGQGASAVGLTASVRKDPMTHEWTLEGGALVLADKGFCLIDEFDKMNDADRTSIHEAMEQQSISISKAGIVTSLQARCAILAAANPIRGRYNPTIPFSQNVELTEPILSRFDVLCVVKDTVDPVLDDMLARFVVGSHTRSHPQFDVAGGEEIRVGTLLDADIIPQDLLKKYIMYARTHIKPKLHGLDQEKLSLLYADLRRESLSTGSYPITVRHLESMIRMAEASAKMHLRDVVRTDDIDLAIRATIESFINAQKMSVKRTLERGFRKYISRDRDQFELLAFILGGIVKDKMRFDQINNAANRRRQQAARQQMMVDDDLDINGDDGLAGQESVSVPLTELEQRAKAVGALDVMPFLHCRLFRTNGYTFNEQSRTITKAFGRRLVGAHEEL